jgi:hypothetical protein
MGIFKIQLKQVVGVVAAVILVLLVISAIGNASKNTSAPGLNLVTFTNSITGITGSYYTNKAQEVASVGPAFVNSDAFAQDLTSQQFNNSINLLRSFVATQSHDLSADPVISNVSKSGDTVKLSLFIDSN